MDFLLSLLFEALQTMDEVAEKNKQMAVFAPIIRTERLTKAVYDKEKDRIFLTDLWNSYTDSSLDTFVWIPELINRPMRNTTLSPETCNRMEVDRPLGESCIPLDKYTNLQFSK
jgi:hypothetical protein